jgi:hypothetical protein
MEVACTKRGRPSYRWANAYHVVNPESGCKLYPPVKRSEAYDMAREFGGDKVKVEIK